MMTEEKQDFAQEPPLTDGEVKLLRLLLQRVASPDFDFGFCGPRTGGPEDFGPRAVSVSRSPLLTPADLELLEYLGLSCRRTTLGTLCSG